MKANHGEHGGHGVYWALDEEGLDGSMKAVHGPFQTEKDAANFILQDFSDWWNTSEIPIADRIDDGEKCSGTWLILKQVVRVRPTCKGEVRFKLKEAQ